MRTLRNAFNGGKISEDAASRSDIGTYNKSCTKLKNFIPHVVGVVRKRGGFAYLADSLATSTAKLIDMSVSDNLSFVLEFTHLKLRIFDNRGRLVKDSSGNVILLTTPWSYLDIQSIQSAHKVSALFVVCPDKAPRRVFRTSPTEWSVDTITFNWGPAPSIGVDPSPWGTPGNIGYPSAIAFHENRLWFGGTQSHPQKFWASSTNDYIDMVAGPNDNDGFNREIASNGLNAITWFSVNRDLLIGTLNEEFLVKSSDGRALSNTNISILSQTGYGSKRIKPLSLGNKTLFIQGSGDKIREFGYSFAEDSFSARNLSILNPVEDDSIIEMVFQQDPDSIVWVCTKYGKLLGLTYDSDQKVTGWHEHDVGGEVLALATIPDFYSSSDSLFAVIRRGSVKTVEVIRRNTNRTTNYYYYMDKSISSPGGGLTHLDRVSSTDQVFTGVSIYAGSTISVVVEGSHICDIDVLDEPLIPSTSTNGRVSITGDTMTIFNIPYGAVGVGLKYESELQTVPLELGDPSQVFTGSKVQIVSANFKMSKSYIGFQYGVGGDFNTHLFKDANVVNNSMTGDLSLMGSVGEDTGIIVKVDTPFDFGLSLISIVFKITETPIR
jgi:hypothetical protein